MRIVYIIYLNIFYIRVLCSFSNAASLHPASSLCCQVFNTQTASRLLKVH